MIALKYPNVKENLYYISEDGQIWSEYKKDYLSPTKDKDGYLKIRLSGGSRDKKIDARIATLVAWSFIGPPPKNMQDPTINHIDGNIINNHFTNLEWMERGKNSSIRDNTCAGANNGSAKLHEEQVIKICELIVNSSLTYHDIAKMFDVGVSTIADIAKQKRWKSITKNYDFSCRIITRDSQGRFTNINKSLSEGNYVKN